MQVQCWGLCTALQQNNLKAISITGSILHKCTFALTLAKYPLHQGGCGLLLLSGAVCCASHVCRAHKETREIVIAFIPTSRQVNPVSSHYNNNNNNNTFSSRINAVTMRIGGAAAQLLGRPRSTTGRPACCCRNDGPQRAHCGQVRTLPNPAHLMCTNNHWHQFWLQVPLVCPAGSAASHSVCNTVASHCCTSICAPPPVNITHALTAVTCRGQWCNHDLCLRKRRRVARVTTHPVQRRVRAAGEA